MFKLHSPTWFRGYNRTTLSADILAAVIVTIMLIPQSLAYALLAGLPPEVGLYASIAPLILYALLGSSRVLAVGPVAIISLMTATTIHQYASPQYPAWQVALILAFLSGVILLLMGGLRLGFLANFLSHPVISGFISASSVLIAISQTIGMFGMSVSGHDLVHLFSSASKQLNQLNWFNFAIGIVSVACLWALRRWLKPCLLRLNLSLKTADMFVKAGPIFVVISATLLTYIFAWQQHGIKIVGDVPQGLPTLTTPIFDLNLWQQLLIPALLMSIVGFVESVSIAQTLAAKHRQRIKPDQELFALGGSNVAAALSGGMPVTGGLARSVINFDAGAKSQAAGLFTALVIAIFALYLMPALYYLPQAVLSATIVVAVSTLIDFRILKKTWLHAKTDFWAAFTTIITTLLVGVEQGLMLGVGVSLALFLYRTSQPHIAEVGLVKGTEHFRNVLRHEVTVDERLLSLRMDESLYFANTRAFEDFINATVATHPHLQHLILQCSAMNDVDSSALESLLTIEQRLKEAGIELHLSEIKGPVMDKLKKSHFCQEFTGKIFLSHYQAVQALRPEMLKCSN